MQQDPEPVPRPIAALQFLVKLPASADQQCFKTAKGVAALLTAFFNDLHGYNSDLEELPHAQSMGYDSVPNIKASISHQRRYLEQVAPLICMIAEQWGIDVPILQHFSRKLDAKFLRMNGPYLREEQNALYLRGQSEISREILVPRSERKPKQAPIKPANMAVMVLREHPNWPDCKIAKEVGCHPSTLSRSQLFQDAKTAQRSSPPPRGWKNASTRDIDASDD